MNEEMKKIWKLALPYLKKGIRKRFDIHTKSVIRAMEELLEKEKGDPAILLPAAILHDVGWSKVPKKFQETFDRTGVDEGMRLHLKYGSEICREILKKLGYNQETRTKISQIIAAHKFSDPKSHNKRMLIDADNLSDAFRESFEEDCRAYKNTPQQQYEYRINSNHFYTPTAKKIFASEMAERKKEFLK